MKNSTRVFVPSIADNNLLSNFVDADATGLLFKLLGGPIYVAPSVIDLTEKAPYLAPPHSETHKFIYDRSLELNRLQAEPNFDPSNPTERYLTVKGRTDLRSGFVNAQGILWSTATLTPDIVALGLQLRQNYKTLKNRLADAECLALAKTYGWQLLTDDNGMVDAASTLNVKTERTCSLLKQAIDAYLIPCFKAAELFNVVMVDRHGFRAYRNKGIERLWLRCKPSRCEWERV